MARARAIAAAELRRRARIAREIRDAVRAVAAGPAPASAHLMAGGVPPQAAHAYSPTITKKAQGAGREALPGRKAKKRPGRKGLTVSRTNDLGRRKRHRIVPVALWTREDMRAVALTGYRPKNDAVAAYLAALALSLPTACQERAAA